jgi:hypothetical protein
MGKLSRATRATIEPGIRKLVRALNSFEGLQTVDSCEGHANRGDEWARWEVCFSVEHSERGWFALEFVAWIFNDCRHAGKSASLWATAPPPYLNGPGDSLFFQVEGDLETNPDELAAFLMREKRRVFTLERWAEGRDE